jgi:hypothetical protein
MHLLASVRATDYFRRALKTLGKYCDMTPQRRSNPLPDNGLLPLVSAATDALVKINALP